MFNAILRFSVKKKLFVGLTTLFLLIGGIYSMLTLPIDAVPDITNNQVQIVTVSPTLAPQEVEQLITMPVEIAMSNIMNVTEIRSVSRFGLSVVTVVFKENVPTLDARQLVNEQIQTVSGEIPSELGAPELMPITTGLGEIYQYVLKVAPGYEDKYDAMELRTIQDWIVKRQLSGIPGIVEINSFGGYLKQYEVAVDPDVLFSLNITIGEVFEALNKNNQNTGGSYIEKVNRAYYIRSEGMINRIKDIELIVVANRNGIPIHISDIGAVRFGAPKRFGAMTMDGEGECVGGIAMMLKGANANVVTGELEKRVEKIQKILPEGVSIEPYLNREYLDCDTQSDRGCHYRIHRTDYISGQCACRAYRCFCHSAGHAVCFYHDAAVQCLCQSDEPGGDRLRYCCRRLHCDTRRHLGPSIRAAVPWTYLVRRRNGYRGGEGCFGCGAFGYFCRVYHPYRILPFIDADRYRGQIFHSDG